MKSFSEAIRYKPNRVLHSVYASDYGSWYKPQTVHQARKWTHFVQETLCEECCYIQCWKGVPWYILSQKTGSWHTCLRWLTWLCPVAHFEIRSFWFMKSDHLIRLISSRFKSDASIQKTVRADRIPVTQGLRGQKWTIWMLNTLC